MKNFTLFIFLTITFLTKAQVGVNTTTPEAALDIKSSKEGLLIPRVVLASETDVTTITNPKGGAIVESTLVYNLGTGGLTPSGFYYWNGLKWTQLVNNTPNTFSGKFIINATGAITITGIPFKPSRVTFVAYPNVEDYNIESAGALNQNTKDNVFGSMNGYALSFGGSVSQQVIYVGGSGNSINNISRFSSSSHCIGLRYANQNGVLFGITSANLTSFNANGFTLNVDSFLASENVVVVFEAYK